MPYVNELPNVGKMVRLQEACAAFAKESLKLLEMSTQLHGCLKPYYTVEEFSEQEMLVVNLYQKLKNTI